MTLEQQLQLIIDDAANYNVPPIVVRAIAPVLKSFASQLNNLEYYVLQNLEDEWILTTITNPQLQQDKRVIYAFTSVSDARNFQGKDNPDLLAVPIPVVQLLFRLFSLQQVDSIIFFDEPQNFKRGVEVPREHLSLSIEQQLKLLSETPPDIA